MLTGGHVVIYSQDAEADRAFLGEVLKLPSLDAGDGWLIFGLPPSEMAVHPAEQNDVHEFYLLCNAIEAFMAEMAKQGSHCVELRAESWGLVSRLSLPGGGKLGVYQPRHARPEVIGPEPNVSI